MQAWREIPSMAEKGKGKGKGMVQGETGKGQGKGQGKGTVQGEKGQGKGEGTVLGQVPLLAILDRPNPDPADSTLAPNAGMPPPLDKMPHAANKMSKRSPVKAAPIGPWGPPKAAPIGMWGPPQGTTNWAVD